MTPHPTPGTARRARSSLAHAGVALACAIGPVVSLAQHPAGHNSPAQRDAPAWRDMESTPAMEPTPAASRATPTGSREQGGATPSGARDPDAYAQGLERKTTRGMEMADTERFSRILLDKFEFGRADAQTGQRIDGFGWYGGDIHRLFVKADAEREDGRVGAVRVEALWDRVFAPFWSTQLGVRRDAYAGPSRNWIAAGIQGLAPYWFDAELTAYVGEGGRTALRAESSYELFLTQRLIVRPTVEAAAYGRDDPERAIGRGLSSVEAGVRLRYEIRRQFAPYIGVSYGRSLGRTADLARAAGRDAGTLEGVIGLRLWY